MPNKKYDVIVVGGGPAGANAAYPLVEAGLKVAILDGGLEYEGNLEKDFEGDFEEIRRKRSDQYKLLIGKELKDIVPSDGDSHSLSMTSGNRAYVSNMTDSLLPLESKNIQVLQSLAKGGLSEAWGSSSDILDNEELKSIGVNPEKMKENYQEVIDRIGVSGKIEGYRTQEPPKLDNHGREVLNKYLSSESLQRSNFIVKQSLLAVITKDFKGRKALAYKDLEYSMNVGNSIYRARFTIEEMEKKKNFDYIPNRIVQEVRRKGKANEVIAKNFKNNKNEVYQAKYVVMAAGSLNTVRIIMKSLGLYNTKVPFLTKPHFIIPCLHAKTLGNKGDRERHSLCQLAIEDKRKINGLGKSFSQLYSYKSLMLFKLAGYSPLPAAETMSLLSIFSPSLVLIDTRFPSFQNPESNLQLVKVGNQDKIVVSSPAIEDEGKDKKKSFKEIKKELFKLGLWPLKVVNTPLGSSAHYAGGIPVSSDSSLPLRCNDQGKLAQIEGVYIADSSTWQALPAKPPALTIMANANRVAKEVLREIKGL